MYTNNLVQLYSFFIFTLLGVIISIIFDIFRILRKTFKTPDIITYIEDILFWIITGTITLIAIFLFNNGELRIYIFLGIAIGSILYMLFISRYFIKANVFIINLIKNIIHKILHIILKPILFIYSILRKLLIKPIYFICINIKKSLTKIMNKIKNIRILNKKVDKREGI